MRSERICLFAMGLLLGMAALGCRERNPAYLSNVVPRDASVRSDTSVAVGEAGAGPVDQATSPVDWPGLDARGPGSDAGMDVRDAASSPEAASPDARDARDARDLRGSGDDTGPDSSADVPLADAADSALVDAARDVPAGIDVSADLPPICHELDKRDCSSPGNPLVGACHAGTQTCTNGFWGPCVDEAKPAPAERCDGAGNGIDDNCNGMTDEGCVADCVVVAPTGNDLGANGTTASPFATVSAAMIFANAQDGGVTKRVCVAGGATCSDEHVYTQDTPLVMANGGRVQGNYALSNAVLTYCSGSRPPTTTLKFVVSTRGVVFDQGVVLPSELSGFVIERYAPDTSVVVAGPISAISVSGGLGVMLSGIFIKDAPIAETTYGIAVESGGQVTIVGSSIAAGQGRTSAIGVYVDGGSVNLRNNCDLDPTGFCNSSCSASATGLGIRGRDSAAAANVPANSSAVFITGASPRTSTIVANNLCGGTGRSASGPKGASLATLRCESGACATVAGNSIQGGSGVQTLALNLLGGTTVVDGNVIVGGCGTDFSTGVVLDGAATRLQNNRILGGQCSGTSSATFYGVRVLLGSSSGEPDLHSNDIEPMGTFGDCESIGVSIERLVGDAAPAGILRNNIISAGSCRKRIAVREMQTAAARVVENNDLYPGPTSSSTVEPILYHRADQDALTAAQVNALAGAAKNISADPSYVSYSADLHLSTDSPCIDQGTPAGAASTDGDGNTRPLGSGFDIGAYEFRVR